MSTLFDLAFLSAAPFWALMIVTPTWRITHRVVSSPWLVLPTLVVWAVAAIPLLGPLWTLVVNPSLTGFERLLADPAAVTAVWAQIIAWDLFVGRWIYLDSRRRDVHPLVMAPVLVLAILLSPIGLPVYLGLRSIPALARRNDVPAMAT
ncbi:ABA4-like family protein [Haloechinothrix halophila]|uniref:ABA4-like family protein n=1 Tax=Haloechinothrix halophila TaxID=1069073 RepID=UPI00040CCD0D|nr:ABA4-like family protein [Haloechinothrix halophila]